MTGALLALCVLAASQCAQADRACITAGAAHVQGGPGTFATTTSGKRLPINTPTIFPDDANAPGAQGGGTGTIPGSEAAIAAQGYEITTAPYEMPAPPVTGETATALISAAGGGKVALGGASIEVPCDHNLTDESRTYITPGRKFIIPDAELPQITLDALNGDPNAAFKLQLHFSVLWDNSDAFNWRIIGAENGHLESKYSLAIHFLDKYNYDNDLKARGVFWLYGLAKIDYRETEKWLKDVGYTLKTAQPENDSLFPNDYKRLSKAKLAKCKTGALRGNKKAAWLLGKYYMEIIKDVELSEYWYRIGAQNGNQECQYILGQIMNAKEDEFEQVRGQFWLDQANKNGYKILN